MADAPDTTSFTGTSPDSSPGAGAADTSPATGWKARIGKFEKKLNKRTTSPKARKLLLIFSSIAFVAIAVTSYIGLPDGVTFHWWAAIVLVLITTPFTVLCNSAEFKVMASFSGRPVSWLASARLTLIATAANLLPLPGGIMIRTQALRADGASLKRALSANAIAGGAWVAVGALATGILLMFKGGVDLVSLAIVLVGLAAASVVLYMIRRVRPGNYLPIFFRLLLVEVATVGVNTVRVMLAFAFLGMSLDLSQAVALTTPTIIAAAIGIFPAGLGLRELLAGAIGVAVSLPIAQSVAATAVDRVFSQAGLALLGGGLLLVKGKSGLTAEVPDVVAPDTPSAGAGSELPGDPKVG